MENEEEYYEERAAIRQYDGGQSRRAAERGAREDVARFRARLAEGSELRAPIRLPVPTVRGDKTKGQGCSSNRKGLYLQTVHTVRLQGIDCEWSSIMGPVEIAEKFIAKYKLSVDLHGPLAKCVDYAYGQGAMDQEAHHKKQKASGGKGKKGKTVECQKCGQELVFGKTSKGKWMPLDQPVDSDPGIKLFKLVDGDDGKEAWFVKDQYRGQEIGKGIARTCHFDTCGKSPEELAPLPAGLEEKEAPDWTKVGPPPMADDELPEGF